MGNKVDKQRREISLKHAAIAKGIERAAKLGYMETEERTAAIIVELRAAGFKIVRKPKRAHPARRSGVSPGA